MLIILSGTESINKNFIAKKVFCELNPPFQLSEGYTMDFDAVFASSSNSKSYVANPYQIYDPTGKLVYDGNTDLHSILHEDDTGVISEKGKRIFDEADALYDKLFLDIQSSNRYNAIFTDFEYDFGIDTSEYEWDNISQWHSFPHSYNDVINRYKNKTYPVHIIHGSFSKAFIDLVKRDIGAENVRVYNIFRHPTIVTYFNEKTPAYYVKNPKTNPERNRSIASKSVLNAYSLYRYDDITHIRFEDMIKDGYITIEGIRIDLPEGYADYNGLITTWEKDNFNLDHADIPAVEESLYLYDHLREIVEQEYSKPVPEVTESVFNALGYTVITLEQIVAPKE